MSNGKGTDHKMDRSLGAKQRFVGLLRRARQYGGYKQPEMALLLGLKYPQYWQYEAGNSLPKTLKEKERIEMAAQAILDGLEVPVLPDEKKQEQVPDLELDPEQTDNPEPELEPEPAQEQDPEPEPEQEESEYIPPRRLVDSFSASYDDRSFEEQMQDLGVEIVKRKKNKGEEKEKKELNITSVVKFTRSMPYRASLGHHVKINKTAINFGKEAAKLLGIEDVGNEGLHVSLGVGDLNGSKKVLLAWKDQNGYKLSSSGGKKAHRINGEGISKRLVAAGLEYGTLYRLYQVKKEDGVYVGIPEESGGGQ